MPKRQTRTQRGYSNKWSRYRAVFLQRNPVCVFCKAKGIMKPANVVDHITPHRGDMRLFWDTSNHQALCYRCHNSLKQSEERIGYSSEVGDDGWPIDPRHPANESREV